MTDNYLKKLNMIGYTESMRKNIDIMKSSMDSINKIKDNYGLSTLQSLSSTYANMNYELMNINRFISNTVTPATNNLNYIIENSITPMNNVIAKSLASFTAVNIQRFETLNQTMGYMNKFYSEQLLELKNIQYNALGTLNHIPTYNHNAYTYDNYAEEIEKNNENLHKQFDNIKNIRVHSTDHIINIRFILKTTATLYLLILFFTEPDIKLSVLLANAIKELYEILDEINKWINRE